jgi:di- and tripeptidase
LKLLNTIECTHGAVLSLVAREDILFAGCQDGYVRVWDLQTNTFIRTIIVQEVNPLSHYHFGRCAHLRCVECGHSIALYPRIGPLRLLRQWASQSDSSSCLFPGRALTLFQRYSDTFDCTASWNAHSGIVLSSIIARSADPLDFELITGGNDGAINVISLYASHHLILNCLYA